MYALKHLFNALVNPLALGILTMALGALGAIVCASARPSRAWVRWSGIVVFVLGVLWCWIWSTRAFMVVVGVPLERVWPAVPAEAAPAADAIVVLGGGMGAPPPSLPYPDMWNGADRAWHAARLYRAGKAPRIITSGAGDRLSTVPLLRDFGVPEAAICCEDASRNTEENAAFVQQLLCGTGVVTNRPRVLLVTSAWHMTRARYMFARYAPRVEIIPAATDYEATTLTFDPWEYDDFLPNADALMRNTAYFKEWLGQLAYRLVRR